MVAGATAARPCTCAGEPGGMELVTCDVVQATGILRQLHQLTATVLVVNMHDCPMGHTALLTTLKQRDIHNYRQ